MMQVQKIELATGPDLRLSENWEITFEHHLSCFFYSCRMISSRALYEARSSRLSYQLLSVQHRGHYTSPVQRCMSTSESTQNRQTTISTDRYLSLRTYPQALVTSITALVFMFRYANNIATESTLSTLLGLVVHKQELLCPEIS